MAQAEEITIWDVDVEDRAGRWFVVGISFYPAKLIPVVQRAVDLARERGGAAETTFGFGAFRVTARPFLGKQSSRKG